MGGHQYTLHVRTDLDRHQDLYVELGADQRDFLVRLSHVQVRRGSERKK